MFKEYYEIVCPFCDKGKITICKIPSFATYSKKSAGKGSATASSYSKEQEWVDSKECSICHKQTAELEKALKNKHIQQTEPVKQRTSLEKLQEEKRRLEGLISMGYQVEKAREKLKEIEEKIQKEQS